MKFISRSSLAAGIVAVGIGAFAAARFLGRHPVGNRHVPEPKKAVDLDRYLGKWFEIARYDQSFERGCEAASAEYALRSDGRITVINRCRKSDGRWKDAKGVAKIVDPQTHAKLKVRFFGPFSGDYWILDHGDNYDWSIVGEPSGRYLWILAREASPDEQSLRALLNRVSGLGYDSSMLVFDRH